MGLREQDTANPSRTAGGRSCCPSHGRQVPSSGNGARPGPPALGHPQAAAGAARSHRAHLWVSLGRRLFQVESSTLGDAAYVFKHIIRLTCSRAAEEFGSISASWNTSGVLHMGDGGIMLACI